MKKMWIKKKIRISTVWLTLFAFVCVSTGLYYTIPGVRAFIGGRQNRGASSVIAKPTKQSAPRLGENAQAYFPFDGDAYNKVATSRTNLTDNNTVTQVADESKKAAQFTSADSEYLSAADNDSLTPSGDFTVAAWVKLDTALQNQSYPTGWMSILSKDEPGNREYALTYNASSNIFSFMVSYNGSDPAGTLTSNITPVADTWYLLVGWFDPTTDKVYLSVNNGTATTENISSDTLVNGSATLEIGKLFTDSNQWYLNGKVDEVGLWDRALTSDERTELYNSGNGITYSQMSSGLKSGAVSYWTMDEPSGTRYDKVGTNNLTDNNTVTNATGKVTLRSSSAAQFTRANSEYLSAANTSDLTTGDIDFSIATWVYMDSKPADFMNVLGKWGSGGNEYTIDWSNAADRFRFVVSTDGGASNFGTVTANNLGAPSLDTWYFIVAWHDATNNQLGIQVNNGTANTTSYSAGLVTTTSGIRIGSLTSGTDRFWDGRIDELAFWRRTLTSAEKTSLYNSGSGTTYVNISDALKKNLMTWWTLDEASGTRNDSQSNQPIMTAPTIASGVTQTTGKIGYAYDFPGTSTNYITVTDNSALDITGDMSIAAWVWFDAFDSTANVIAQKGNGTSSMYQFSRISSNGTIQLCINGTCGYSSNAGIVVNRWYHIVGTFTDSSNTAAFYINGGEKGTDTNVSGVLADSNYSLTIGSASNNYRHDGKIDELRIYNKVLSSSEVTALVAGSPAPECDNSCKIWYKIDESSGTSVTDYSGNANTGTASAATIGIGGGVLGLAGDFASSRKITSANDFPLSNLTAMAWIYPHACVDGAGVTGTVMSKGDGGNANNTEFILNLGETNCSSNGRVLGAFVNSAWKKGTGTVSLSTWTHVAMTYDGSNVRFYINGVLDTTVANAGSIVDSSEKAYVGIQGSGLYNPFNGLIDDARIYNRKLTDTEIKNYYLQTKPL